MSDEIKRYRGDTKPFGFRLWLDKRNNVPLDIEGFSFRFTVNEKIAPVAGVDNPVFTLLGEIFGASSDGWVRFLPTKEQMDLDPTKTRYYDFEVTDAEGFVGTEKLSKLNITQDLSK